MADPIAIHISDIVMMPVSELKPHPKNPNSHSKEQIKRLAEILSYQGWRYPIKVSKLSGYITSGHGRLEAARFLGLDEVPVSFQDYADTDQEYADIVADNAIASWSDLDFSAINLEIENFSPDFNIDLLGIEGFKIDPSELPELPTGDRKTLRQMAFQLTEEQISTIERALDISMAIGEFVDTGSSNSNGNALARMAETFITQNELS